MAELRACRWIRIIKFTVFILTMTMSQNIFPPRRNSVGVRVFTVTIGGGAPVVVQMTNTDTEDESSTTSQVAQLAVPDRNWCALPSILHGSQSGGGDPGAT